MDNELLKLIIDKLNVINERTKEHGKRFDAIDKRFDAVDNRLNAIENKLDQHDKKIDAVYDQAAKNAENISQLQDDISQQNKVLESLSYKSMQHDTEIRRLK